MVSLTACMQSLKEVYLVSRNSKTVVYCQKIYEGNVSFPHIFLQDTTLLLFLFNIQLLTQHSFYISSFYIGSHLIAQRRKMNKNCLWHTLLRRRKERNQEFWKAGQSQKFCCSDRQIRRALLGKFLRFLKKLISFSRHCKKIRFHGNIYNILLGRN